MKSDDKQLLEEVRLTDVGIVETKCVKCGGAMVLQRIINPGDVPYTLIACKVCGCEPFAQETAKEQKLIEYAAEMMAFEEAKRQIDQLKLARSVAELEAQR